MQLNRGTSWQVVLESPIKIFDAQSHSPLSYVDAALIIGGTMTDMVIVESGAKGKKIKQILGKGYIVDTCKGHVQDLPSKGSKNKKEANKHIWTAKPGMLPEPPWDWTGANAEKTVKSLLAKAKKHDVETVYIATDPDREGEFIAWRLKHIFEGYNSVRITFNEITKKAVISAIESPRDIDMDLVDAAKVRRFMDRLVGFRASKFCRSWRLRSMGRVQTPTLGFIVEREAERDAFVPQPFYAVTSIAGDITFKVRFHEKDDTDAWFDHDYQPPKHHPDRTNDENLANLAVSSIKSSKTLTLTQVKSGTRSNKPKPPFSTPSLLRTAGSHPKIGWGSRRIMSVANDLYQGGHITYIRTDSTRTNPDARENIRDLITNTWGSDHLRDSPGILGKDATDTKNVQDAHEAIRPTDPSNMVPDGLDAPQLTLYRLIWARFAASQMCNSEYENLSLRASVDGLDCPLTGSVSWRVHAGWEAAYGDLRAEPRLIGPNPPLNVDSTLNVADEENGGWRLIEDQTKPPSRYRQHTLVEKMENDGIGRPSTYATTVEKLIDRKYIIEESKALIPTPEGRLLWEEVAPMYGNDNVQRGVFESIFTATMESSLDSIEHGSGDAPVVWSNFVDEFSAAHTNALNIRSQKPTVKQLDYMNTLLNAISDDERSIILDGNEPSEISGDRCKEIIDQLKSQNIVGGPSEKQLKLINKLVEESGISIDDVLTTISVKTMDELTGGRNGTASTLIGKLLEIQGQVPKPPSDRQIKYTKDLIKKAEIEESLFCQDYNVKSVDEMTASQASDAIQTLQDKLGIKGRGRRRR